METENKQLMREIETLKRENAELREINSRLKQSLDEPVIPQSEPTAYDSNDSELHQQTLKQLSDVKERLTLLEQVTAATQRRELQQEGAYESLSADSVYEELRFDPAEEHLSTRRKQTTHIGGNSIVFSSYCVNCAASILFASLGPVYSPFFITVFFFFRYLE